MAPICYATAKARRAAWRVVAKCMLKLRDGRFVKHAIDEELDDIKGTRVTGANENQTRRLGYLGHGLVGRHLVESRCVVYRVVGSDAVWDDQRLGESSCGPIVVPEGVANSAEAEEETFEFVHVE